MLDAPLAMHAGHKVEAQMPGTLYGIRTVGLPSYSIQSYAHIGHGDRDYNNYYTILVYRTSTHTLGLGPHTAAPARIYSRRLNMD